MRLQESGKFEWFEYMLMGCGWALLAAVLSAWIGIDLAAGNAPFLATVFLFFIPGMLLGFVGWTWSRLQQRPSSRQPSIGNRVEELASRLDEIEGKVDEILRLMGKSTPAEKETQTK